MLSENIKRMAETAVLLPIANLVAATTLLAGYAVGFGSNLGWYFSLDDVFAASLIGLMPFYIAVGYWVLMEARLYLARAKLPTDMPPPHGPFDRRIKWRRARGIAKLVLIIAALMTVFDAIVSHYIGRPFDVFGVLMGVGGIVIFTFLDKSLSTQWPMEEPPFLVGVAFITIIVLLLICAKGLSDGQRDRFLHFTDAKSSRAQCGAYVVIRKTGTMYLAVGKDDRHRLIDEDCAEKILIPAVKPRGDLASLPGPIRQVFQINSIE